MDWITFSIQVVDFFIIPGPTPLRPSHPCCPQRCSSQCQSQHGTWNCTPSQLTIPLESEEVYEVEIGFGVLTIWSPNKLYLYYTDWSSTWLFMFPGSISLVQSSQSVATTFPQYTPDISKQHIVHHSNCSTQTTKPCNSTPSHSILSQPMNNQSTRTTKAGRGLKPSSKLRSWSRRLDSLDIMDWYRHVPLDYGCLKKQAPTKTRQFGDCPG